MAGRTVGEKEIKNLQVIKYTKKQREELLIEFIQEFLKCFNSKIAKTEKQEEILSLIYQFRYFMCLPFNLTQNVKDVDVIKEDVTKTEKQLLEKAIEKKVISDVPLEVMQHLFETRIVILEELYYRIANNDVNLCINLIDNDSLIPLQSFELGVVCIIGRGVKFFEGSELEKYIKVSDEENIQEIKQKIQDVLENKEKILELYNSWKKDEE